MPRALTEHEIAKFREEVCGVATRLFAEKGLAGVTLRALAAEMRCSPMTPYRYFENKEEVFQTVRAAAFARLGERIHAVGELHPDPLERIRATGREFVRFALEEPHGYRIMFQLDQSKPGEMLDTLQHAEMRRGWQVLVDAMDEAVQAGTLDGNPTLLAHLAWVPLHGLLTLHFAGKLELGVGLEELIEPLLENFFRGATPRAPAGGAT